MANFETPSPETAQFDKTARLLQSALEDVIPHVEKARAAYPFFGTDDMRRLYPNLPDLAEFYIGRSLEAQPQTSVIRSIIEQALSKLPARQSQLQVSVSEPFYVASRKKRVRIDEPTGIREVRVEERAYQGQINVGDQIYQFNREQPVYTIAELPYADFASNADTGSTYWYEFAPSSAYLAELVMNEYGRGMDKQIDKTNLDEHLSIIEKLAQQAAMNQPDWPKS